MMVYPEPGIERQPRAYLLPQVEIAGYLMPDLRHPHDCHVMALVLSGDVFIPGISAESEPVHPCCNPVSAEQLRTLVN